MGAGGMTRAGAGAGGARARGISGGMCVGGRGLRIGTEVVGAVVKVGSGQRSEAGGLSISEGRQKP